MPGNVDNRIIKMQFENRQFEKNIAKSKKSLEDFKKGMNFEETSRDMEKFAKSANSITFENLANNIQKLTDRFTGLGNVGDYVLRRLRAGFDTIAMSAETFAKSISLDQISVGQGKYDALNKAVMTIVSTGKYTEKQAYEVFDRLMTYTAETSYSFSDMVNQIATFTSTGVNLDKAEMAMEGIANMSAKAGQGVSEATNAMSIFSKALGQSYLSLQQWQSLNLSAHVITEEFRQVLADTAVEMGTLVKEGDKYYTNTKKGKKTLVEVSNLENTLNQQWATSAVLMETLMKYYFKDIDDPNANWETFAGTAAKAAQRALNLTDAINAMKEAVSGGWLESFRIVFGDLSEAMVLFTDISNRAIESLEKISSIRNMILTSWREGGRGSLIDIILGDYGKDKDSKTGAYGFIDMLDDVGKIIWDGFVDFMGLFAGADDRVMFKDPVEGTEYFAAWLGGKLAEITTNVQTFMQNIRDYFNETIIVDGQAKSRIDVIHEIVMGLAAALKFAWDVISGFGEFFINIIGQLSPSFDKIESFLGTLGLTMYQTAADMSDAKTIPQFFQELAETFRPLTEGVNEVVEAILELLGVIITPDNQNGSNSFLSFIGEGLKFLAGIITSVGVPILTFIKNLALTIKSLISGESNGQQASQGLLGALGDLISGIVTSFNTNGLENLHTRFESVIGWFKNVNLGAVLAAILGGLTVVKIIQTLHNAKKAFSKITAFFDDPGRALKQGFIGDYEWFSERVLNISKAIALLAASVVLMGSLPTSQLIQGVIAVTALMAAIFGFTKLMESVKGGYFAQVATTAQIMSVALGIAAMSVALSILVASLSSMKDVSWDQYAKMMAGLGGILLELVAFMGLMKLMNIGTKGLKLSGIVGFSAAIAVLVMAIQPFAGMSWDQFAKMLAGLGGILLELIAFMGLLRLFDIGVKGIKLSGIAIFAAAIGILVLAIQPFAGMNWSQYGKMMAGLGGILLELIAFMGLMRLMDIGINGIKLAGVIAFTTAIAILVAAIQPFAGMSWDQYGKVMAGLGGVLLELVVFMGLMRLMDIGINGIKLTGIIAFTTAIAILVAAIQPFAGMSWDQYGKVMAGLGGVLLELVAFMGLMQLMNIGIDGIKLTGIIAFSAAIAILVSAIQPFAGMSWDQYGKVMAGFGGVLLELVAFMALIKGIKVGAKQTATVAAMVLVLSVLMSAFGSSIASISGTDWTVIAAFAAGIAVLLIAIAGALAIVSNIPLGTGLKGIVLLGAGLTAILGILAIIAPILIGSVGNSLASMSGKLAMMADMFRIFSERMSGVDDGAMEKAKKLINDLYSLVGDIGKYGAISISSGSISTALFTLGSSFQSFSRKTSNLGDGGNVIKFIQDLAGAAGGLDRIAQMNIDLLTSKITGLGGALMLYAKGAIDVNGEGVNEKDLDAALRLLKQITETIGDDGFTVPDNMPSETELGTFGAQLAALAGALVLFESAGAGLGTGTDNAIRSLVFFQSLKSELEKADFLNGLEAIFGFNNTFNQTGLTVDVMEQFGRNIESLGSALKAFADSTTTIDEATGEVKPDNYDAAIEALVRFSDLETKLPKLGGIKSWWEGNQQTLSDLGNDVQLLGSGLMTFSNKITGQGGEGTDGVTFDPSATDAAITAMDGMLSFLEKVNAKMPRFGGLKNFFTNAWNGKGWSFKDLGDQVGEIGDGLRRLGKGLNTGGWSQDTGAEYALAALDSILGIMEKLQSIENAAQLTGWDANRLASLFAGFTWDLYTTDGIQNMFTLMSEISDEFNEWEDIDTSKIQAFQYLASALASLTSIDPKYDWETIGLQIDTGIASGLLSGMATVTAAASQVSAEAYNAASASAATLIATISTILSEEVVAQPTITPVLDMSNVTRELGRFTSGISNTPVTISGNRAALMAGALGNQNGTDLSGVCSRIDAVEAAVEALGDSISNMQIVLDTGIIAGGLTPTIDGNLGRRNFLAARRNTLATIYGKDIP